MSEVDHGCQSLGSDAKSLPCTSDEGVEDCGQGPSAMEEETPNEKDRKEDHPSSNTLTSKNASDNQLEVVPHTTSSAQSLHTHSTMCASSNISHQTPRSLPADTVGFFKQLADMLQGDKFDQILPPQIQLDEQTICDYEQVLKKGMSGDLRKLGKDSRYQEFNEVLTALLSCRRIPSNLQQEFLSLRRDLPSLASRAFELNKEVTHGMLQRVNRSTVKELESCMDRYRTCEDNLLTLEQEKELNKSEIGRLFSEIGRLQSRNEVIDSEIKKLTAEADALRKASAAQSHKIANLDGIGAADESTLQHSMDDLHKLENEWRKRVDGLNF